MKPEQGHSGGEVAPRLTAVELLADIRDLLRADRTTDMPSDVTESRDYQVTAAAGDLYIDLDVQFGYVYIPNCPRDVTIYAGTRGALIGSFKSGAFISFRIARQVGLTIAYAAGAAAGYITVMTSARPLEVNPGAVLVNPGTAAGSLGKAEDTAHVSGDVGVMLLGVRNSSGVALADTSLDYIPISTTSVGAISVAPMQIEAIADSVPATMARMVDLGNTSRLLAVAGLLHNGTTNDRPRNNVEATALASAARTATANSADITNHNARGVAIWFNITAVPTIETVTLSVSAKDPISGVYSTIFTGAAEAAAATRFYQIYPGVTETATVDAAIALPRTWRVTVTHSASGSFTYSVGYCLIN